MIQFMHPNDTAVRIREFQRKEKEIEFRACRSYFHIKTSNVCDCCSVLWTSQPLYVHWRCRGRVIFNRTYRIWATPYSPQYSV